MEHLPHNDDELVQQMNLFMQWLHNANRNTRIKMVRGILKACHLEDLNTLKNIASGVRKRKKRKLDLGQNDNALPLFVNVPGHGIALLEDEEIQWFDANDFVMGGELQVEQNVGGANEEEVVVAVAHDQLPPPENQDNDGIQGHDGHVEAANAGGEVGGGANENPLPPENQNNYDVDRNNTIWDYLRNCVIAFLHVFRNPQNAINRN